MQGRVSRAILRAVSVALIGLAGAAETASAATFYDSSGFESPLFVPGDLTGQDPLNGPWQKSGVNASTATVQVAVKQAGLQAVQVNRAANANADARWGVLKPHANVTTPIAIDWAMNVAQSSVPTGSFGPFFGVEAYDSLDNPSPLLAGSLGVDAKTGEVLFQQSGTGFIEAVPNFTVPFDQWNHYRLLLDYQSGSYSIFVNGALKATEGFVDSGITDFTDAPIATVAAAGDPASLSAAGTAYVDNYVISEVPEPGLAWVGLLSFAFLKRNSRSTNSREER
jgi:hypothetical protein